MQLGAARSALYEASGEDHDALSRWTNIDIRI